MATGNRQDLSHILVIVFVTGCCCIGIDAMVARRALPHRTFVVNSIESQRAPEPLKHKQLDSFGDSVKVFKRVLGRLNEAMSEKNIRRPSKRFHHYLTMTRDIYPSRRSYIKPARSDVAEETNLVPVPNHFSGVKTWTVPYSKPAELISTMANVVNERKYGDNVNQLGPTSIPQPNLNEGERELKEDLKDILFDNTYLANRDAGRFAPIIDLLEDVQENPFDATYKPFSDDIWTDKSIPQLNSLDTITGSPQIGIPEFSEFGNMMHPSEKHAFGQDILPITSESSVSGLLKVESTPLAEEETSVLTEKAKEAIFDREYIASRDIGTFGPVIDLTKIPYSKGRWSYSPQDDVNDIDTDIDNKHLGQLPHNPKLETENITGDKGPSQSGRRRFSDFGRFKAVSGGDNHGANLFSLSNSQPSFGKFVPDKSSLNNPFMFSSGEARWGTAKNRDLPPGYEGGDGTVQTKGAFRRVGGAFDRDQSDCHNIDTKSCHTDAECSCFGMFRCTEGACKTRTAFTTTSPSTESSRDVNPKEYWQERPYTNEQLGISN